MILVTGATGKLGSLIVDTLLKNGVSTAKIAVLARNPAHAAAVALAEKGLTVKKGDYADQGSLETAFQGVRTLMFVSSSELGERAPSHLKVIAAAKKAGVQLVVYTSILNAETSPLDLAADHLVTERALKESGLPFVLLRNGWYFENYTDNLASSLEHGAILGAAGQGKYAMATRKDYAEAAAAVLTSNEPQDGKIYELGGHPGVTLGELATEVSSQSRKLVAYVDLPSADFEAKLLEFALPPFIAHLLADSDAGAKAGSLDTTSDDLQRLIKRPSTSLAEAVKTGLAATPQG